jgi:hypothetical protein
MWRRDPTYENLIKDNWKGNARGLDGAMESLRAMQGSLQKWSFEVFGSVRGQLKQLRSQLEDVRNSNWQEGITREEKDLLKCISELLAREEVMMRQRSRIQWLKEGDRNTAYFHARCKERARQNRISIIKTEDGKVCNTQKEIEDVAVNFYIKLFSTQGNLNPEEVVRFVPSKVTNEMNQLLCKPFCPEEVEKALFMMKPNKAPGPDGFTAGFF